MTIPMHRRLFLSLGMKTAAVAGLLPLLPRAAGATDAQLADAMRQVLGPTEPKTGRVTIEIPPLAENGNSVPVTVSVDSPMTAANYVKAIYLFSPVNPLPDVAHFYLGPRSGRARVQTSIRLANTQNLHAVAVMSDGSAWMQTAEVIVTLSACIDAG